MKKEVGSRSILIQYLEGADCLPSRKVALLLKNQNTDGLRTAVLKLDGTASGKNGSFLSYVGI